MACLYEGPDVTSEEPSLLLPESIRSNYSVTVRSHGFNEIVDQKTKEDIILVFQIEYNKLVQLYLYWKSF